MLSCRDFRKKNQPERSARNKSSCTVETSHPVERNKSCCREFNYISSHPTESSARIKSLYRESSHPVERLAKVKSPCREFNYLTESSARHKSPCREFNYISNHPVENSARKMSPCREINYKQVYISNQSL